MTYTNKNKEPRVTDGEQTERVAVRTEAENTCPPADEKRFFVEDAGYLCQTCHYELCQEDSTASMNKAEKNKEVKPNEEADKAAFDYRTIYDDAYYEQYMANFVPNKKKRLFYRFLKRSFDIVMSLLMMIVLSPFMLIIALAVKCDSKGEVIFKQERVGKNGKLFTCYKFRSMKKEAPRDCASSLLENPEQYQTRVGRFLRRFSLDELPQLWCVFIGTMTFIGYRPLVLTEEKCNEMRRRLGVFASRPGISGLAQVYGRDDLYYKNKAIMDAEYSKSASVLLDLKLMVKTVLVVMRREGNHDETRKSTSKKERAFGCSSSCASKKETK